MLNLTRQQIDVILQTVKAYGTLSLAAANAGVAPSHLKRLLERDGDLKAEVDDALELFQDAIRLTVLERATEGKSDAMLKLAAEAFVPQTFKTTVYDAKKDKPTRLTLRTFDDEGQPTDPAPATPLKLTLHEGL